jgi:hypothetical protein
MFKKNKKKLKKNDFIQDASLENKEKKVDFELKKIQLTEKKRVC